jgi:hypothetical protein
MLSRLNELVAYANETAVDRKQFMDETPKNLAPFREDIGGAFQIAIAGLAKRIDDGVTVNGPLLTTIQRQGEEQLEATKKLDQRLFEFVNATKGIMRAINGNSADDQDALIENAKMIQARAADRGIEITLEDAIKRAREQEVYARG